MTMIECRNMTDSEFKQQQCSALLADIAERRRPMTAQEVTHLMISQNINTLVVDDSTSLRMKDYYPEWADGVSYDPGFKVCHNEKLWRVRQSHTAQVGWEPENTPALWEEINEVYDGTVDDPIPYGGNMALEQGKHYIQNNVIYLCDRDTVNPVYQTLCDLVGLHVKEV